MSRVAPSHSFALCTRSLMEIGNAGTSFFVKKEHVFVFRLIEFEEPLGYRSRPSDMGLELEAYSGLELWIRV